MGRINDNVSCDSEKKFAAKVINHIFPEPIFDLFSWSLIFDLEFLQTPHPHVPLPTSARAIAVDIGTVSLAVRTISSQKK